MSRKPNEPKPLLAADGAALFDADGGAMLASHCTSCGRRYFPQRTVCAHCGIVAGMQRIALARTGTVHASTVIRVRSALGHEPPYAYGYVELDGLLVFTRFSGGTPESFQPGDPVELAFENLHCDGQGELLIHVFRKVVA
ncbi:MAG: OB-fold domain-containing protein [Betaproteobacteria bacterium]|nr:OB-fold domain-containing protein [Betaproteobacteria bacterium]